IVLGDQTAKQIDARCVRFETRRYPLNGTADSMNEVPVLVDMGFRAPSPFWEDVTPQSVAFTTSAVAMPQGTAPSEPVLTTSAGGVRCAGGRGCRDVGAERPADAAGAHGRGAPRRRPPPRARRPRPPPRAAPPARSPQRRPSMGHPFVPPPCAPGMLIPILVK